MCKTVGLWSFNHNLCLEFFDLAGSPAVWDHMWQNYRCDKNHAYLRCFSFRIFFVQAHLFWSKACYLQEFPNLTVLKCLTVFFIPNTFLLLFSPVTKIQYELLQFLQLDLQPFYFLVIFNKLGWIPMFKIKSFISLFSSDAYCYDSSAYWNT